MERELEDTNQVFDCFSQTPTSALYMALTRNSRPLVQPTIGSQLLGMSGRPRKWQLALQEQTDDVPFTPPPLSKYPSRSSIKQSSYPSGANLQSRQFLSSRRTSVESFRDECEDRMCNESCRSEDEGGSCGDGSSSSENCSITSSFEPKRSRDRQQGVKKRKKRVRFRTDVIQRETMEEEDVLEWMRSGVRSRNPNRRYWERDSGDLYSH